MIHEISQIVYKCIEARKKKKKKQTKYTNVATIEFVLVFRKKKNYIQIN